MTQSVFSVEDEARLNLTQDVRENIIRTLVVDRKIPTEQTDRILLMQALDGMDRTVLAKTKIKSDDRVNQQNAATTAMIAEILTKTSTNKARRRTEEIIDVQIERPVLVDGELTEGSDDQLNYNTFMTQMQNK